ncbi:hypothetical protein [Staphylococcus ratti]|uniref:Cytosolic protein n=1 Tax=Staphylococcus ratti TaxID=2892440 RepID=A0ABY3PAD1_9STAP|nr:hypothetical protein [Staphylococcus ratti]UEX89245.1 hypothetical protein LN051_06570 [Staphylococcus ratti]
MCKVDDLNHLIEKKKEQEESYLFEKRKVNDLLNEYDGLRETTNQFNHHLLERYCDSRILSHLEQNSEMFQFGHRRTMRALYDKQNGINKDIRCLNNDIIDIERRRDKVLEAEYEKGVHHKQ